MNIIDYAMLPTKISQWFFFCNADKTIDRLEWLFIERMAQKMGRGANLIA